MLTDQELEASVLGQKYELTRLKPVAAGPLSRGIAEDSLELNLLLLGAVGKSDGSAVDLHKRWLQGTACEGLLR
jgi:hypothetical protein